MCFRKSFSVFLRKPHFLSPLSSAPCSLRDTSQAPPNIELPSVFLHMWPALVWVFLSPQLFSTFQSLPAIAFLHHGKPTVSPESLGVMAIELVKAFLPLPPYCELEAAGSLCLGFEHLTCEGASVSKQISLSGY